MINRGPDQPAWDEYALAMVAAMIWRELLRGLVIPGPLNPFIMEYGDQHQEWYKAPPAGILPPPQNVVRSPLRVAGPADLMLLDYRPDFQGQVITTMKRKVAFARLQVNTQVHAALMVNPVVSAVSVGGFSCLEHSQGTGHVGQQNVRHRSQGGNALAHPHPVIECVFPRIHSSPPQQVQPSRSRRENTSRYGAGLHDSTNV